MMNLENKQQGGNRRPQTFKDCLQCSKHFGPVDRLAIKFCSRLCLYAFRKGKPNAKRGKKYPHLQRARIGNCLICGKEYRAIKDFKTRKQKFCSATCFQKNFVKNILPNVEHKGLKDEKNHQWKGNKVGYHGLHKWVARKLGKPMKCDHCLSEDKKKYEWASIDHSYIRDLEAWVRLCTSCHRKYDFGLIIL